MKFALLACFLVTGLLQAETGDFGLVSERHFYPMLKDKEGEVVVAVDLFLGGYKPVLTLETLDGLTNDIGKGTSPEILLHDQFKAFAAGDLEALLALYEEGASRDKARMQYKDHLKELAETRTGASMRIESQAHIGPYVMLYFENLWKNEPPQFWYETAKHVGNRWWLSYDIKQLSFLTLAVNFQSKAGAFLESTKEMTIHRVSYGLDGSTILVPESKDKYDAKVAIHARKFTTPIAIEDYAGKDKEWVFVKNMITQYRQSKPADQLNNLWEIQAGQQFSADKPIDLNGWYGQERTTMNSNSVYGFLRTSQGRAVLIGNNDGDIGTLMLKESGDSIHAAVGIIGDDLLSHMASDLFLVDDTLVKILVAELK